MNADIPSRRLVLRGALALEPKGEQKRSNCRHFVAESNTCTLVDGQISPEAPCIIWAKQA